MCSITGTLKTTLCGRYNYLHFIEAESRDRDIKLFAQVTHLVIGKAGFEAKLMFRDLPPAALQVGIAAEPQKAHKKLQRGPVRESYQNLCGG